MTAQTDALALSPEEAAAEMDPAARNVESGVAGLVRLGIAGGVMRLVHLGLPIEYAVQSAVAAVTVAAVEAVHHVIRERVSLDEADEMLAKSCSGIIKAAGGSSGAI